MNTPAQDDKPLKTWFRTRQMAIGLVIALLGAVGLFIEFATRAEARAFEAKMLAEYSGVGFAPLLIEPSQDSATAQPTPPEASATSVPGSEASPTPTEPGAQSATSVLGYIPDHIQIPAIGVDAPVVPASVVPVELGGKTYYQLLAPRGFRAGGGWYPDSALLGVGGNTVISGHHNAYGKVFENVFRLQEGDLVIVSSGERQFQYVVKTKVIFPERFASVQQRLANAAWIGPTEDERLTLVTCWPAGSNTHRVVVVALPYSGQAEDPVSSSQLSQLVEP